MHDMDSEKNGRDDDGQLPEEEDKRSDRVERCDPQDVVGQSGERFSCAGAKVDAVNC